MSTLTVFFDFNTTPPTQAQINEQARLLHAHNKATKPKLKIVFLTLFFVQIAGLIAFVITSGAEPTLTGILSAEISMTQAGLLHFLPSLVLILIAVFSVGAALCSTTSCISSLHEAGQKQLSGLVSIYGTSITLLFGPGIQPDADEPLIEPVTPAPIPEYLSCLISSKSRWITCFEADQLAARQHS